MGGGGAKKEVCQIFGKIRIIHWIQKKIQIFNSHIFNDVYRGHAIP